MRRLTRTLIIAALAAIPIAAASAHAQAPRGAPSANDSLFRRARRLVSDGSGAEGRALVDSLLRSATEGTPEHGDALFWRGALAETAAAAERDYKRVIVEYPLSPYVDDALLSLAELEQARGDRAAAYQHLQRFVREHPPGPARARAGLAAARLAFEQRDVTRGCAMIADARSSAASDVELRNQIDYYGARCPSAPSAVATAPAPTATPAASPTVPRDTQPSASVAPATPSPATPTPSRPRAAPTPARATPAPTPVASTPSATPRGRFTIQLAAYNTQADANRLVAKLAGRGVKARVSGEAKPFRVRLGFYPTQQAAASAVADLKARGIIGFVTEEAPPAGAASP
jgi:cell division protein FtsN